MAFKLQSPGPVAVPLLAHWVMTRDSPGEKPDACTRTRWPDRSPAAGVTVICWCPLVAVADAAAVAGVVVTAGGGVVVGLRVKGAELLLLHPAARTTSTAAAVRRRGKLTILTCPSALSTPGRALAQAFTFTGPGAGQ
jgi:hypothetical protein